MRKVVLSCILMFCSFLLSSVTGHGQIAEFSRAISSNNISSIVQDNDGYIWIGTDSGLNRYNGTGYKVFHASDAEGGLPNDNILDIEPDRDGSFWLATEAGCFHYVNGKFTSWNDAVYNPVNRILELEDSSLAVFGQKGLLKMRKDNLAIQGYCIIPGISRARHAAVSPENDIWFTTSANDSTFLHIMDVKLSSRKEIFLGKGVEVYCLNFIKPYTVFLSTSTGLLCFDSRDNTDIKGIYAGLKSFVGSTRAHFILPYKNGNILLGLADKGMYVYNPSDGKIDHIIPESTLPAPEYVCFVDRDSNIWLGDKENDVRFIASDKIYSNLFSNIEGSKTNLSHIAFDSSGLLWAIKDGQIVNMEPDSRTQNVMASPTGPYTFLMIDDKDRLWTIKDGETIDLFSIKGSQAILQKEFSPFIEITSLAENRSGNIFIPELFNMTRLGNDGRRTTSMVESPISITQTKTDPGSMRAFAFSVSDGIFEISSDGSLAAIPGTKGRNAHSVLVGKDGTLWLATYNKGVFHIDPKSGKISSITISSGLVDNTIKAILEDHNGNIWFSSSRHITRYNPKTGELSTVNDDQYYPGRYYHIDCAAKSPDGKLYFGGDNGITTINPDASVSSGSDTPLFLDYLAVNGVEQTNNAQYLKLNHRENSLQLRFSGIDFKSGFRLGYAYRLKGYENRWNNTNSDNLLVAYNSLPPGKYVFQAKVRNRDGSWSKKTISLPIIIRPAFWATNLAKSLYTLFFLSVIFSIIYLISRWRISRERLAIDQEHIDLVTNISHEFRSPLSLIYGPVKELAESTALDAHDRRLVEMIKRNAERLRMLSEQVLSTASFKPDIEKLSVAHGSLSGLVNAITDNFRYAILEKKLHLETSIPDGVSGFFDGEKVEKIMSNLLSNAVKYTPVNGRISISLYSDGNDAVISVQDDGSGIPPEKLSRLFVRYERLGAEKTFAGIKGTGIGLNYSYYLARMHKGSLKYSPASPHGAIFTLKIPVSEYSYTKDETAAEGSFIIPENIARPNAVTSSDKEASILIVEDNNDILAYLSFLFSDKYNVMAASDGIEAESNLKIAIPDLVISDVMMPRKGGYALCSDIKNSSEWEHIPVILLTAKADAESSIEGLRCGADAYIPKPFDPAYLKAVVKSQIANRLRIQRHILNLTPVTLKEEKPENNILRDSDKAFIERMHEIMDNHLDDDNFNVEDMTREVGMSYSSLYAKVKDLTGKAPLDFMNTYRMNIAMELLKSCKYTVNEVADKIGASSPANFSRNFKKHFGVAPSSVR